MQQTIDTQKKLAAQLQLQLQSMTDKAELLKLEQNKRHELEAEIEELKEKNAKVISSCHVYRNLIKQLTEHHLRQQQKAQQAIAERQAENKKSQENREVDRISPQSTHSSTHQQDSREHSTTKPEKLPTKPNPSYAALFKKRNKV
jgi:hypothetical protein